MELLDLLGHTGRFLILAVVGAQLLAFVALVLWWVWHDAIAPRLLPAGDVERMADDIVARFPDPEAEAFARHEAAWYRSEVGTLLYWSRVRRAVSRRLRRQPRSSRT
jgi:hypothetical protein